jgi:transketolase
MDAVQLKKMAANVRMDAIEMIYKSGDGHPAPSLSAADIVTALYFGVMNIRPQEPLWEKRDRFILSKGHACPALYAALGLRGFFPRESYPTLRKMGSILQGHPDMKKTPGVDMTAGSLGNGLGAGFGMAMASRLMNAGFRTYVVCGDGELGEGIIWEAALAIAKYGLDNLTLFIDNNGMQSGGGVEEVGGVTRIGEKFAAFDWQVLEIDGHDMKEILSAIEKAHSTKGIPTCIVAKTVKGKGVSFMEHNNAWHKRVPTPEEYDMAMSALKEDAL